MGFFTNVLKGAVNSLAKTASEIQEKEERYSGLSDASVKNKLRSSSSAERIAAKRVLEDRGYQFKDKD